MNIIDSPILNLVNDKPIDYADPIDFPIKYTQKIFNIENIKNRYNSGISYIIELVYFNEYNSEDYLAG